MRPHHNWGGGAYVEGDERGESVMEKGANRGQNYQLRKQHEDSKPKHQGLREAQSSGPLRLPPSCGPVKHKMRNVAQGQLDQQKTTAKYIRAGFLKQEMILCHT